MKDVLSTLVGHLKWSRTCGQYWLTESLAADGLHNNYDDSHKQTLPRTHPSNVIIVKSTPPPRFQTLSVQLTALHKYQTPHSDTCTLAWYGCCQTPIASGREVLYTFAPEPFWKGSKRIDQPYLMIPDKLGRDIDPFYDPLRQLWCKLHCNPVRNTSTTGKNQKRGGETKPRLF